MVDLTEAEATALLSAVPYCRLAWRDDSSRPHYAAALDRAQGKLESALAAMEDFPL
jgi:hypothetical protein